MADTGAVELSSDIDQEASIISNNGNNNPLEAYGEEGANWWLMLEADSLVLFLTTVSVVTYASFR